MYIAHRPAPEPSCAARRCPGAGALGWTCPAARDARRARGPLGEISADFTTVVAYGQSVVAYTADKLPNVDPSSSSDLFDFVRGVKSYRDQIQAFPAVDPQAVAAKNDIVGALTTLMSDANAAAVQAASFNPVDVTAVNGDLNALELAVNEASARLAAGDEASAAQAAAVEKADPLTDYGAKVKEQEAQAQAARCSPIAYLRGDSGIASIEEYATQCAGVSPTWAKLFGWWSEAGTIVKVGAFGVGGLLAWRLKRAIFG